MSMNSSRFRHALLGASAMISAAVVANVAYAADTRAYDFDMPAQPLTLALKTFGATADQQLIFSETLVKDRTAPALKGSYTPDQALAMLLSGSGLTATKTPGGVVTIRSASDPQSGSAADDADGTVQALIVTAQKREEDIQDVPIAISAFTQEDLTRSQVAGGPDLITQVPNMTFTKTNFSSYSVQLRGIGTQAISATTDPAVAVAFNNTPFIRNRFFEQEFYDLERVEVLRGPQGTLYGRNATAGVVNIISAKPKFRYAAKLSVDVGNYSSSRLEGMLNIPLVEDKVALRIAGAWTKRDGYAVNELTGNPIDGRDLWSTRVSLRLAPSDRLNANLIWEHFEENDDRLRSGKQLCKKDVVTEAAGFTTSGDVPLYQNPMLANYGQGVPGPEGILAFAGAQAVFSQGCTRNSLYALDSFQRPNGYMLPYYLPLGAIGLPTARNDPYVSIGNGDLDSLLTTNDQPVGLRTIQSTLDPDYTAASDLGELQISLDLGANLSLTSETAYATDEVYSLQDFNRFNTAPGAWIQGGSGGVLTPGENGGIFCDPQLGCSDRLVAVDISTAKARQFSQELRLSSDFDGAFNFSLGANFLRADSEDKYYVFINSLSLIAAIHGAGSRPDNSACLLNGFIPGDPTRVYNVVGCTYIDPNPIGSVNDEGHNYFLSKNPYKLISYAVFGEAYYNLADNLKITTGLRWTVDKKEAPRIPTWILATNSVGYPIAEVIEQEWREPTGRLAVDWKPDLSFTDDTMIYASYAHGYKAGGANPPGFIRVFYANASVAQANAADSATRPVTFDPEFVNAFEVGTKNTLAGGHVILNLAGFYYDYTGYQVSEIVDRSAFNRNFDSTVWGVELESDWRPFENFRLGLKGGYEDTRIKDGEEAIDLMDRTAGDPRWTLSRPFPTYASSCILPSWLFVGTVDGNPGITNLGGLAGGNATGCELAYQIGVDPVTLRTYQQPAVGPDFMHGGIINYTQWSTDPTDYPGLVWPDGVVTDRTYPGWDPSTAPNHGEGIAKPLGGNQLPNAPHWTWTLTGDYTIPMANDWLATLHTDLHWQGASYWRVFNDDEYDKLDEYFTMNVAAIFTNEERGWNIMAYVKNVTDETAITGAFLNSDDTGLTTNVFLTEPRLYGVRVTKTWEGGPLLGSFGARHDGPYPFTLELGGQVQRTDAPSGYLEPSYASAFASPLDVFPSVQQADLDWGDTRDVKLTYRPAAGPWSLSAGVRYGKANGKNRLLAEQSVGGECLYVDPAACAYFFNLNPKYGPYLYPEQRDHADASAVDQEKYTLAEFAVGRDVGIGGLNRSTLSVGLRYGDFDSSTDASLRGVPDWYIPAGAYQLRIDYTHTTYKGQIDARRSFRGVGPTISWQASYPLHDWNSLGRLDLDWSVSGGALFGERKVKISGDETRQDYRTDARQLTGYIDTPKPYSTTMTVIGPITRSGRATIPILSADLGLSYTIDRVQVGAGYRWERYYDAIDGGFTREQTYDRTLDGPYFKIAVGFGG